MHYCYILYDELSNKTYVGYTNRPERRIKQHNGLLKGGAKYTTRQKQSKWSYLVIVASPDFTKNTALSFEWYVKNTKYKGVNGRICSLIETIVNNNKFKGYSYYMYVSSLMYKSIHTTKIIDDLFDKIFVNNITCLFSINLKDFIEDTY